MKCMPILHQYLQQRGDYEDDGVDADDGDTSHKEDDYHNVYDASDQDDDSGVDGDADKADRILIRQVGDGTME